MLYSVKGFFGINEDMVQMLLDVGGTFHTGFQSSVVLIRALSPACSSAIIFSTWGLNLFKMTFSMTLLE